MLQGAEGEQTLAHRRVRGAQYERACGGGRDKGTDLAPLVAACEENARAVVCFGEARERFLAAFADSAVFPVLSAGTMEEALDAALSIAEDGDVVVLSPACASFDEFSCFEERGDVFKRLVADRAGKA